MLLRFGDVLLTYTVGVVNDLHFLSQFQKVYPQLEASRMSKTLFELLTRHELIKRYNYSNDTAKFFIKAVCEIAIIERPSLSV